MDIFTVIIWFIFTEQIAELERKVERMKTDKMKAERQSTESTTKLNVLTNYFKEKEAQLQR